MGVSWSNGVVEHCKISNSKHQISMKSQIPIFNDKDRFGILNFGHCRLFGIWDLLFGIFSQANIPLLQTYLAIQIYLVKTRSDKCSCLREGFFHFPP